MFSQDKKKIEVEKAEEKESQGSTEPDLPRAVGKREFEAEDWEEETDEDGKRSFGGQELKWK